MTVCLGDPYVEPGATASDGRGRDFTDSIYISSEVNTAVPDTYQVTYRCSDRAGNTTEVIRTVIVFVGNKEERQLLYNQIGYFPKRSKIAFVTGVGENSFTINSVADDAVVERVPKHSTRRRRWVLALAKVHPAGAEVVDVAAKYTVVLASPLKPEPMLSRVRDLAVLDGTVTCTDGEHRRAQHR